MKIVGISKSSCIFDLSKRNNMNTQSTTSTMKNTSCICPKCGGSGKLDWTSQDAGVCYKCEGAGYLGEMPEGFNKMEKEIKREALELVKAAHANRRFKGRAHAICLVPTYECYMETHEKMIAGNIVFRFKYNKFFMSCPDCVVRFGFDGGYCYEITIGNEFIEIKSVKL